MKTSAFRQMKASLRRGESAYTLFEIMLVLGIIVLLVGSAIYLMAPQLQFAKTQRVFADFQAINIPLKSYEMVNFNFPTTAQGLQALVEKPSSQPVPRRWQKLIDSVPLDPWGNPYQYVNPGKKNPQGYDLYSWGPDRKEGGEDDIYEK
jgi:general secretion pathway protein G